MASLKLSPKAQDDSSMLAAPSDGGGYGYGTSISLEEEQVTALGAGKLTAGQKVRVVAYVIVSRVSVDVGEEGEGKGQDLAIQLTDMELTAATSVNAGAMFPSSQG